MDHDEVLQIISSGGGAEITLSCDQLMRLYATMIAQLSPTIGHDQLLQLLSFGGLLYNRAFEDFQNESKVREQMGTIVGLR